MSNSLDPDQDGLSVQPESGSKLFAKVISRRLKVIFSKDQVKIFSYSIVGNPCSDTFTILRLWLLGLAVSNINESKCTLMSPEHYF